MEPKPPRHNLRAARQEAVRGENDVAGVLATWTPEPKADFSIEPAKLKDNPVFESEEQRIAAIETALTKAVEHMHEAEAHKARPVAGMKTYAVAIMTETFGLSETDVAYDHGALSDLTEYLTDMVYATKGIDMRDASFDPENIPDEDVALVLGIRGTWDLPEREFSLDGPYMYKRVIWVETNPAEGN